MLAYVPGCGWSKSIRRITTNCTHLRSVHPDVWTNRFLFCRWHFQTQFCISVTHWGRVTRKCVADLTIIASDNGLSPDRHQAIIWINAGKLLIGPSGTNFSEILVEIHIFSSTKMRLKIPSGKSRPFCIGLNLYNSDEKTSLERMMNLYTDTRVRHKAGIW